MTKYLVAVIEQHTPSALNINHAFSSTGIGLRFFSKSKECINHICQDMVSALIVGTSTDLSAQQICEDCRTSGLEIPIIVLSDKKDTETAINMLNYGADDYLGRPLSTRELVARTKRLLNRPPRSIEMGIQAGGLTVYPASATVLDKDNQLVNLRRREFQILKTLAEHKQRAVSREQISARLGSVWRPASIEAIDVHISKLRSCLRQKWEGRIETVYGVGYRLIG